MGGLSAYVLRRLLFFVPLLFGISIVLFFLMHAAGDPVMLMIMERPDVSQEMVKALYNFYGLDKPVYQQYFIWIWRFLHWDLGESFWMATPVNKLIELWFIESMKLQLTSISLALLLGIVVGSRAAIKHRSTADIGASAISLFGISMPGFWFGIMLILIFSYWLGLFPSHGAYSIVPTYSWLLDAAWHMVLPVAVLTYWYLATFVRLTRTSMLEVLRQDFILAARASGLPERVVIYKHALRNALIPVVTYIGYYLATSVGSAPVTETVFSWPGLGYLYVKSITQLDFPVVMAINMVLVIMVLAVNLATDIVYGFIDPRIKYD